MRIRILSPVLAAGMVAITMAAAAPPAQAQPPAADTVAGARSSQADATTDRLARQLARMLDDPAVAKRVGAAVAAGPVDLLTLEPQSSFTTVARGANQVLLTAKGLPATVGSILQVRLAHPDMRAAIARGERPLVAGSPSDDAVTKVTAYDANGRSVLLDATRLPDRPTLVVDIDVTKAMSVGMAVVRDRLAVAGLGDQKSSAARASGDFSVMTDPYYATRIDYVWLADDHEPWFKGPAEIFSIVGGFGLDGKPTIDMVPMEYLDYDHVGYPEGNQVLNQVLIHWRPDRYLYNFADVVMMEDDGDTNYADFARALIDGLATISGLGGYVPLVNAILSAIPGSWWTDDNDYVESWYTLSTSSTGTELYGASGNGTFNLSTIVIYPLPAPPGCGEASCTPVQAAYISHFTGAGCTGTESYYTPYFGSDGIRRSWDGRGVAGTTLRTVTNRSWKGSDGQCHDDWPNGNPLSGFVTIYR